jgi:2-methylisocitrate lyase-like PEP mutase family enzyme
MPAPTISTSEKRARFRALHESGCFVIPNPWDIGSARLLAHLGFQALASTSSGYAWSTGRPDHVPAREETLAHLSALAAASDLPINADYLSGFAIQPEDVATNVALAARTGVAGLSIEDTKEESSGLYDLAFAARRVRAAVTAAHANDLFLVARTEILLHEPTKVSEAIDKLVAFAAEGADCLYAPGVRAKADITAIVKAVAPRPVNVLMGAPGYSVAELADLGVRRISVGGALAQVAFRAMLGAAEQMKNGSFEGLAPATIYRTLNGVFADFAK